MESSSLPIASLFFWRSACKSKVDSIDIFIGFNSFSIIRHTERWKKDLELNREKIEVSVVSRDDRCPQIRICPNWKKK